MGLRFFIKGIHLFETLSFSQALNTLLFTEEISKDKNISFENNNDKLSEIFALYLDTSTSSILLANERLLCVLNSPIISLIFSYSFKQFDISFPDKFLIFPFHLSINWFDNFESFFKSLSILGSL